MRILTKSGSTGEIVVRYSNFTKDDRHLFQRLTNSASENIRVLLVKNGIPVFKSVRYCVEIRLQA
jgi:hypothetical protein